jgi:polyisoprenoid-binding protein YceI
LEPHQTSAKKSRVYTFVDKTGLGHPHAVEGRLKSGSLTLGAGEEAGELVFDMNSFDADTDAARRDVGLSGSIDASTRRQVNDNMKNTPILNVSQFPTATFAIKSATLLERKSRTGAPLYELTGEFTLRGKTRPIKLEAEAEQKENMTHVHRRFAILQTQYGITPFRKALGAVGVADQLIIHGDLWIASGDAP